MKYRMEFEGLTMEVDEESAPPTLTLTGPDGAVRLNGSRLDLMRLLNRCLTDVKQAAMRAHEKVASDDA